MQSIWTNWHVSVYPFQRNAYLHSTSSDQDQKLPDRSSSSARSPTTTRALYSRKHPQRKIGISFAWSYVLQSIKMGVWLLGMPSTTWIMVLGARESSKTSISWLDECSWVFFANSSPWLCRAMTVFIEWSPSCVPLKVICLSNSRVHWLGYNVLTVLQKILLYLNNRQQLTSPFDLKVSIEADCIMDLEWAAVMEQVREDVSELSMGKWSALLKYHAWRGIVSLQHSNKVGTVNEEIDMKYWFWTGLGIVLNWISWYASRVNVRLYDATVVDLHLKQLPRLV